jgi:uncharacterized protein YndB with AHSA1/START domain
MAFASREFELTAQTVFAVIVDPTTYPDWLVGAADMRGVDDDWPRRGSRFHHRVGFGPVTLSDSTELLDVESDRLLRLGVRARPLISAIATFTLVGDEARCVVSLEEEPAPRTIGNLVRPILDPLTHFRNHQSLKQLDRYLCSPRSPVG